ncbi:MAG TPA: hypothetical protein DEW32_00130 [Dehalococcoidia bacterium]|nr:hypothetical protein [Dehalococcoidia bacterium]
MSRSVTWPGAFVGILLVDISTAASRAVRAAPRATVANPEQKNSVVLILYREPGSRGVSDWLYDRWPGTNRSLTSKP